MINHISHQNYYRNSKQIDLLVIMAKIMKYVFSPLSLFSVSLNSIKNKGVSIFMAFGKIIQM